MTLEMKEYYVDLMVASALCDTWSQDGGILYVPLDLAPALTKRRMPENRSGKKKKSLTPVQKMIEEAENESERARLPSLSIQDRCLYRGIFMCIPFSPGVLVPGK